MKMEKATIDKLRDLVFVTWAGSTQKEDIAAIIEAAEANGLWCTKSLAREFAREIRGQG